MADVKACRTYDVVGFPQRQNFPSNVPLDKHGPWLSYNRHYTRYRPTRAPAAALRPVVAYCRLALHVRLDTWTGTRWCRRKDMEVECKLLVWWVSSWRHPMLYSPYGWSCHRGRGLHRPCGRQVCRAWQVDLSFRRTRFGLWCEGPWECRWARSRRAYGGISREGDAWWSRFCALIDWVEWRRSGKRGWLAWNCGLFRLVRPERRSRTISM